MSVFDILIDYRQAFLHGLLTTLALSGIAWGVGLLVGFAFGFLAHTFPQTIGTCSRALSFFIGAIPLLVLLYWMHYPLQTLFGVVVQPFYTAAALLTALNALGTATIVRSSLDDFPDQYLDAAKVCGLSSLESSWHIQIPLILRQILPALLNLQVAILHMTLFASLISVEELFRVAQRIDASIHKPVEIYTALAFFFVLICLPINLIAQGLRNAYSQKIFER